MDFIMTKDAIVSNFRRDLKKLIVVEKIPKMFKNANKRLHICIFFYV